MDAKKIRLEDTAKWAVARSIKKLSDEEEKVIEENIQKLEEAFKTKRQRCSACGKETFIVITTVIDDENPVYWTTKCAVPSCRAYDMITLGDHPDIPAWKRNMKPGDRFYF
jgi:hypothetical protein